MRDFRRLYVWQQAHALTLAVYAASSDVPRTGYPGLVTQLRRAAAAIPTNIAEGCGHSSRKEFARFLQVAVASSVETEYHLQLCLDLGVMDAPGTSSLIADTTRVRRQLASLLAKVRNELPNSPPRAV
jgi:four helix bundle protein